jgi:hypothetical protein
MYPQLTQKMGFTNKMATEKLKTEREEGKGEHPFEETNSRFRLYFPLTLSIRFRDLKEKKR